MFYGLSWWFCLGDCFMHVWEEYVLLLLLDDMFYRCLLCLVVFQCYLSLILPCCSSAYFFYPLLKVVYWSLQLFFLWYWILNLQWQAKPVHFWELEVYQDFQFCLYCYIFGRRTLSFRPLLTSLSRLICKYNQDKVNNPKFVISDCLGLQAYEEESLLIRNIRSSFITKNDKVDGNMFLLRSKGGRW